MILPISPDAPVLVRGAFWPVLPVIAVIALMIFWMIRVRFARSTGPAGVLAGEAMT